MTVREAEAAADPPLRVPKNETDRSREPASLIAYGRRRTVVVLGIMLAVLLEILDTTIVNVALPTIQGSIGADLEDASWIVTAYLIAVVIALPLVPWCENLLGRRRYTVFAILGFTLASAACGLAQSLPELVLFRALQGLCGGGILTIARSILRDTFPPEQIGRGQGLLAFGAVVGPSVGPTLGGMLTDAVSWRWIFFVNLLPGLAAAALLWFALREPRRGRRASDAVGIGLMALGLGSLQYVLESGERNDWFSDARIAVFAVVGVAATATFVLWELIVAPDPVVDLRLLRRRAVAVGSTLSFGVGFTLFVGIVLSPQFSQGILGFTATLSGNQVLVRAVSIAAFIPVAVIAMTRGRTRPSVLLAVGFALVGWAGLLSAAATTTDAEFWTFGWALVIGGFGFGLLFVPLSVAVLASVPAVETTKVSAMLSIFQQLGASVSTALMVTVIDRRAAFHLDRIASDISLHRAPVAAALAAHVPVPDLFAMALRQATALGFADAYVFSAAAGFVLVPLALLLPAPSRPSAAPAASDAA